MVMCKACADCGKIAGLGARSIQAMGLPISGCLGQIFEVSTSPFLRS